MEEQKQEEKLRIMAGVKWREEGEKSTKYFLNLVKTREASSTLDYIKTDTGIIANTAEIMNYSKEFYQELYSKKQTRIEDEFFKYCPKLSEQAYVELDKEITLEDLELTLRSCKDSTPGLDGIP